MTTRSWSILRTPSVCLDLGELPSLTNLSQANPNSSSEQEKFDCYMLTAAVMTCGGIEFKTKGRDDQAECENISADSNILHMLNNNFVVST